MMDSGNSGSLQSSSGGEEEYDSRSESISSFLNSSAAHFGSISDQHHPQQPPPPASLLSHQPTLFGHPHSQNLDAFPQSLANPSGSSTQYTHPHTDMLWSRGLRSDPTNYASFGNIAASVSSSTQSVLNVQGLNHQSMASPSVDANAAKTSAVPSDHPPNAVKNPKKRTRASRRAPTTVLTTDTSNFRQMVQEFTGIPTAPFSAGSPYSRRLDLFSTGTSNMRSAGHLDSLGPLYPLRPSAQKNQMLSFQGNNSSSNSNIPSFLQHPSLKQHHPSSMLTGKSQGINTTAIPASFDELGLGHHDQNVSLNSGLFPNSSERWRDGGAAAAAAAGAAALSDHHMHLGSSFEGGNKPQHLSNYSNKFNCSASTSEFLHHDKGLDNVTSGGEDREEVIRWTTTPNSTIHSHFPRL